MKIALVYDRVNKFGGAERVLLALHEIWPDAPLYTSVYDKENAEWAKDFKIIPSFLQKMPFAKKNHESFAPIMPVVFESFDFNDYDVVISVTSEAAKGIVTKPNVLHLCYCLTPTRYLWSGYEQYFNKGFKRLLMRYPIAYLRLWDKIAAERPDCYIAISETVRARIKNYYHRESEIIYPPVETEKFKIRNPKSEINTKYFLIVSRLVEYKKVDLVIETFNKLEWNLKIIGVGRKMRGLTRLRDSFGKAKRKNIEFLGQLTDDKLLAYYQKCEAVIFPQEEDFGIVALEAMACGKPVIVYDKGGASETVIDGVTGFFFKEQTVEALAAKLQSFKAESFKQKDCRQQAEKFNKERFKQEFKKFVEDRWKNHTKIISTS